MNRPINSNKKAQRSLSFSKKTSAKTSKQTLPEKSQKDKEKSTCQVHAVHQRGRKLTGLTLYGLPAMALCELNHPAGGGTDTQITRVPNLPEVINVLRAMGYRIQETCYIAQGKDQKRYWLLDVISNMFVKRYGQ